MRTSTHSLPPGLQEVNNSHGLEFPIRNSNAGKRPLRCSNSEAALTMNENILASCPSEPNFQALTLDMDDEQARLTYKNIMEYKYAGYDMHFLCHERKWVEKTKTRTNSDGTAETYTESVMRIYIEYFAPYRITM